VNPQRPGLVDELLELRGGQPEPSRGAEREAVRPLEVTELDLGYQRLGLIVMLAPRVLAADHLLGGKLGHAAQADFRSGILGALDEGLGHLVDVAGGRVVDDCNLAHPKTLIYAVPPRISHWTVQPAVARESWMARAHGPDLRAGCPGRQPER
jgi:hypothetical protein